MSEADRSISDMVNDAVKASLAEDAEDLESFSSRKTERSESLTARPIASASPSASRIWRSTRGRMTARSWPARTAVTGSGRGISALSALCKARCWTRSGHTSVTAMEHQNVSKSLATQLAVEDMRCQVFFASASICRNAACSASTRFLSIVPRLPQMLVRPEALAVDSATPYV